MAKFPVIYADPPWHYSVWNDGKFKDGNGFGVVARGRVANAHYRTMRSDALLGLNVPSVAEKDCCLFLWVTMPTLPLGIETLQRWGFEYKTCAFVWVKLNLRGVGFFTGLGHWTRANVELCLLGTRGKPKRADKGVKQLVITPRQKHSQKPDVVYERIERLTGQTGLEMFARRRRQGWTSIGNELDGLDIVDSLAHVATDTPLPTVERYYERMLAAA